jgi:hypothetical protein
MCTCLSIRRENLLETRISMRSVFWGLVTSSALVVGCGPEATLRVTDGSDWKAYVGDRSGGAPSSDIASLRFRAGLCDGETLQPESKLLNEEHIIGFLRKQGVDMQIERQRADLVYLNLLGVGTQSPARLRVAILKGKNQAGRELHEGILQHGLGSWGVHRSNLAVLGPVGTIEDDLRFAAKLKLPCWGVFTMAGDDDTFVVPGGYLEL